MLGSIILLVVLLFLFINSRWGQNIIREKAVAFLEEKLETEVSIGRLNLAIPNYIELEDVFIRDRQDDTLASVGHLKVEISMLKLIGNKIQIQNLELDNTYANIYRTYPDTSFNFSFIAESFASESPEEPKQKKDTTTTIDLDVDDLRLTNIRFNFLDYTGGVQFKIALDTLQAVFGKTDVSTFAFHAKELMLHGATSSVVVDTSLIPPDTTTSNAYPVITADKVDISGTNFSFDDARAPHQEEGMDYVHLDLRDVGIDIEHVYYTLDSTSGVVNNLTAKEKSGFYLKKFRARTAYHNKGAYVEDFYLETSNSRIQEHLSIAYDSIVMLGERPGDMQLKADLNNSIVGVQDILIFAPDLKQQDVFRNHSSAKLNVESYIEGALKDIDIEHFYMAGLDGTVVKLNGKLTGLPDADKLYYDLDIPIIRSTKKDIESFIPKSVTADINLPQRFSLTGKIEGTTLDYYPDIHMMSTDGSATVKGYLHMSGGEGNERYKLYVTTDRLNIGKILKQDSVLGMITANLNAKGAGFDIKRMRAAVDGRISSLGAMGYTYNDITLASTIEQQLAKVDVTSGDKNATFALHADANLQNEYPALRGHMDVDTFNLRAVNLMQDSLAVRTIIDFNIPVLNPDYPYGEVLISQTGVNASNALYFIDTLSVDAKSTVDSGQNVTVDADFINAVITGKIPLSKAGALVQSQLSKYYPQAVQYNDTLALADNYSLNVNARVTDRPLLHTLLPGLDNMTPITLESRLSPSEFYVNTSIPSLNYSGMYIDSGLVLVENNSAEQLRYEVSAESFSQGTLQFWYPDIKGTVGNNKITTSVKVRDLERKERFAIHASMLSDSLKQVVRLDSNLLLNYDEWEVNKGNKVVIVEDGLYADSFTLAHRDGSITLQSEEQTPQAPLNVLIRNFFISDLTTIAQQDSMLVNGLLNSQLKVHNLMTAPHATGKLSIDNLSAMGDTVGNLNVDLDEASPSEVDTRISLKGRGNDLLISGSYYAPPRDNNNFDLTVDIKSLDMKSSQGLTMGQLKNSSGKITGKLAVTGKPASPIINGNINTDSLRTTIVLLGSPFLMPAETIDIKTDKVRLNDFTIYDDQGNKGVVNGSVDIKELTQPVLDLHVDAREWQVLNSTKEENELFYGRVLISSDMRLTGSAQSPSIDGNLTIHDSTDFTIVVPESDPGIEEREGIVEFIDKSAPEGYQKTIDKDTISGFRVQPGTDLNLNVTIEENAAFNVLIDQASGDLLRVKGEANLNTKVNPDGTIGLAGVYALKDGSYELNYSLVKRKFDIQEGSEIKFAGDPLKAEVDITAEYTANIPPYELVQNEIDETNEIYYKQRLPFSVVLKLTGEILEPEVEFDITLPEERNYRANSEIIPVVKGKLAQLRNNPSEMNKQVFAALILNKFIAQDPLKSLGGTTAEYIARQSASRFISAQLNRLAEQFVKGLEVNIDLQSTEDFTTGEKRNRTDLNLSATKRLFSDRLSVTVGNNFEIEGAEEGNNSNYIPGNLAADYELTKDGRYRVRAFRRRDNINIVDGVSVESGVSFIVTLDYDRFRDLFIRKEARKREDEEENDDTADKKAN